MAKHSALLLADLRWKTAQELLREEHEKGLDLLPISIANRLLINGLTQGSVLVEANSLSLFRQEVFISPLCARTIYFIRIEL